MKTKLLNLSILSSIIILIAACGGGLSTKNNEYLNALPSIAKKYSKEYQEKKIKLKECTDIKKAFKYEKELKNIEAEWKTKIKESNEANPITKPLPFEALAEAPYTISEVNVNKVYKDNLNIKFSIKINEDIKNKYGGIKKNLFVYYKALDKDGNDIPNTKTVATNFKGTKLLAGTDYEAFGSLKSLANLENFAKIKIITKEEYKNKK